MYTYRVYDFVYDDTKSFNLLHKTKFTKEEYENIVNDCRIKIENKIKRNKQIIEALKDGEEIPDEKAEELELWTCTGEWNIYSNIYKMMIKEYGFEELQNPLYTFTLHAGFYGKGESVENRVLD